MDVGKCRQGDFTRQKLSSGERREGFLPTEIAVAGGSLIRWRYNPKDEHLERSCRGTEGDGFPCIGN